MTNKLKKEIEELRALLQTYLASDMDIDEMDFNEVVNYAVEEIQDGSNIFLGHWKDYAFLRGKLSQKQEFEEMINKRINKLKILIKDYKEPEVNEFYARINELKEIKRRTKTMTNKLKKEIENHRQDIKLDESQAPKIPSQVEVNASKVLGDVSGCPVIKIINKIKKSYPFIESELINAFVQGWYDGGSNKSDIRKLQVAKDYLVRIDKELNSRLMGRNDK